MTAKKRKHPRAGRRDERPKTPSGSPRRKKQTPPSGDPFQEREARKYDNPIPSREFILQHLEKVGRPQMRDEIFEQLGLEGDEQYEALRRRVRAMERDGQIILNRREGCAPVTKLDMVRGRVVAHPDGFGFLIPDDASGDLFLAAREMRTLMHGDRALVAVRGLDDRGRKEGALVEILERCNERVVGRFFQETGVGVVVPDNKRLTQDIIVPMEHKDGASHGQIVVVELVAYPTRHSPPIGRVIEVLGEHMAPGMEIDVAMRAHSVPHEWPEEVLAEITRLEPEVPEEAKEGREDIRDLPLVTIDGEDARDFDDAVYVQKTPKGFKLLVAIADVSSYVLPGTALDGEARNRGNSTYFPERVIPMLPEVLSNGLCSLNPRVDRLCMCCEMLLDAKGGVKRSRFFRAVMRSHARLTYGEVAAMLVDGDAGLRRKHKKLLPHLENLYALYKVLRKARDQRGAIDFDTRETRIVFGEDRKIERIVPVERNEAHKMIEECMLAANVATARFLKRQKLPALFRIHEGPNPEKLADLRSFLGEMGLQLKGGDKPSPKDYSDLLASVADRPDRHLIETVLLRSMSQAVYSPDNIGHFGLNYDEYAHFTSPIRRYPDLVVHRAIKHVLDGGSARSYVVSHDDMVALGEHCSMTERRSDDATRDAVDWLKCEYMLDKVGEVFDGTITSVTSFGLFVELDEIYVEGLVHVTSLPRDYFHFDPVGHRMQGERTGRSYRLADRIRVQVVRVNLDDRKIDFVPVEDEPAQEKEGKPARKKGGKRRRRR